ncbi:MAG: hypothetical protein P8P36_07285 [Akkermansiaceae bacterium]|nr:hypothetical protein [Akkermansiaceae bacterium]
MKKYIIPILCTGVLTFLSCNKKPIQEGSESQDEGAVTLPVDEAEVQVGPEQRAAKLGFAQYLPANMSAYSAVMNGSSVMDKMWQTPMGKLVKERLELEGVSFDDVAANQSLIQIGAEQYGEDYFVAYGDTAVKVGQEVIKFSDRVSYYLGRMAVYAGNAAVGKKLDVAMNNPKNVFAVPLKGFLADFVGMFGQVDMPAYYQGVKITDEDARAQARQQLEAALDVFSMLELGVDPLTVERGGAEFEGFKFSGKKMMDQMREDEDDSAIMWASSTLTEFGMSQQELDEFLALIETKNIVALVGELHGYVILFLGSSEDDFVLVDDVESSLCASGKIKFVDNYLDKELFTYGFNDGGMSYDLSAIEKVLYDLLGSFSEGLADQLAVSDSMGDTQDLEVMLDNIDKQARELAAMFKDSDAGYVAYLEDGIKVEIHGGSNMPQYDMDLDHKLSAMSQGEGNLLFANWATNPEYNEGLMNMIDTLVEVSYATSKHVLPMLSSASGEGAGNGNLDFIAYDASLQMFEEMFRSDLLDVWKALRTNMAEGLGAETALVVDLNGTIPKVPNVPEAFMADGKMPRVAYVSTVDDRDKLQASWVRINKALESLLKKASQMTGAEIPMQVPMSSEKDGLKTWFVPIPFQNDDFVPSVSVNDELFFASSSKRFAEGLSALSSNTVDEARQGVWLNVDMKVLHSYVEQWLKLMEDNADELMSDSEVADFKANKEMIETAISALGMMDNLTYHMRSEDGVTRTSLHLKTR